MKEMYRPRLLGAGVAALLVVAAVAQTATSPKSDPARIQTLIQAINAYRASQTYVPGIGGEDKAGTLIGAPAATKGSLVLPQNAALMQSAQATAEQFAKGTYAYSKGHDQSDSGKVNGPTVRAIKAGWSPSVNKFYDASITPGITGVRENLFQGPANLNPAEVLKGWQNSPGHNYALLKAQAHSMGVGFAQNSANSYWVFLVESDAHTQEAPDNMPLLDYNKLWKLKAGARPSGPAVNAFEILPAGLQAIRQTR